MSTRSTLDILAGTAATTETSTRAEVKAIPAPDQPLTSGNVTIIPYNAMYDPQASDFLRWMWSRMQEDDLVEYYFPGQKETGFAAFVRMMSGDAQVGLGVTNTTSDQWKDKVAGFISWTPLKLGTSNIAVAGLIFFREFWDHRTTDEAGQLALHYWFVERDDIDSVLGVCPSTHAVIARYNKRMGLHECGRLSNAHTFHGEPCDAVLFEITKQEWLTKGGV